MKILLDDERVAVQPGWTVVRSSQMFQTVVETHHLEITEISFDHDLGDTSENGMWCLKWLVDKVIDDPDYLPEIVKIITHSANTDGRRNICEYAVNAYKCVPGLRDLKVLNLPATSDLGKRHVTMPPDFDYKLRL